MLTYCVINSISRRQYLSRLTLFMQQTRRHCSSAPEENLGQVRTLLQFCVDRYYTAPGQINIELFQHGLSCNYGPLGMELRKNLLDQWWHSVTTSSDKVFGIKTRNCSEDTTIDRTGHFGIVDLDKVTKILGQKEQSRAELIQQVQELLQRSPFMRRSFFQGKCNTCKAHKVYTFCIGNCISTPTNHWLQCKTKIKENNSMISFQVPWNSLYHYWSWWTESYHLDWLRLVSASSPQEALVGEVILDY